MTGLRQARASGVPATRVPALPHCRPASGDPPADSTCVRGAMTRTMYDGITAAAAPRGRDAWLPDTSTGTGPTPTRSRRAFPTPWWCASPHLRPRTTASSSTSRTATPPPRKQSAGSSHAATPGSTRQCTAARRSWPQVRAVFGARDVPEPHWWVAQYDGIAELPAGAVAKQYKTTPGWDESVVADYWPGVDPERRPHS